MTEVTRLFDLLDRYKEIKPDQQEALCGKEDGVWVKYSIDRYVNEANYVSSALLKLGLKKDDKIAIISSNRPEFSVIDMGAMQIGVVVVPIYPTISEADYEYILNHAEIKVVFAEGEELLRKIEHILPTVKTIIPEGIYTFKNRGRQHYYEELLQIGKDNLNMPEIKAIKDSISPKDIACMIYTSGTTGKPKGVMLSHAGCVANIMSIQDIPAEWATVAFSFLPMCHAYEKLLLYMYQYRGMAIYYCENLGKLADNIKEVNPTFMTCVPRVLEKFYDKLYQAGKKQTGMKKKLYYWAVDLAFQYNVTDGNSKLYMAKHAIADKLIYSKWRQAIGGHFDKVVSGSAALQPRLVNFFTAMGMPIYEGYGLTEASPVVAVYNNGPRERKAGTIGKALSCNEVKIDPSNNEILVKGPNVMMGYYKAPELTAEVMTEDGYLRTGDAGFIDEDNLIHITGRIKSLFKTSMGKYINPQMIEEKFVQSPFIDSIMVVGENQKFAAAIISPNFGFLKTWCEGHGVTYMSREEVIKDPSVKARFTREINKLNESLGDYERIKRFELVPEEWTIANEILTPTLKVKRNVAKDRYKDQIDKMFA